MRFPRTWPYDARLAARARPSRIIRRRFVKADRFQAKRNCSLRPDPRSHLLLAVADSRIARFRRYSEQSSSWRGPRLCRLAMRSARPSCMATPSSSCRMEPSTRASRSKPSAPLRTCAAIELACLSAARSLKTVRSTTQPSSRSTIDHWRIPLSVRPWPQRSTASSLGALPRLATRRVRDDRFPVSRAETEASLKVNHQLTDRNSLMLRYAFTTNREAGDAFNTAGWTDPSARGTVSSKTTRLSDL